MSVRLYVKLPKAEIEKEGFEQMFTEFSPSFTSKLIKERKKGQCRGFGFVTVPTDDAAEEFIAKYNEQTFIYNGEPFKDEEGKEFKLVIEKALPRSKGQGKEKEESKSKPEEGVSAAEPSRRSGSNRPKKARHHAPVGSSKPISVAESIQPDPRWATELTKLKEMFTAQTTNS
jgi:RNA recognition motif-containing protein